MGILGLGAAALTALCLMVAPVGAAELEGFGPIKFGMTKDEALAALEAIGVKGEWEEVYWLVYEYPIHDRTGLHFFPAGSTFKVKQVFIENRAVDAYVDAEIPTFGREICLSQVLYFVAAIKNRYDKVPIFTSTIQYKSKRGKWLLDTSLIKGVWDEFVFDFKNEALITMTLQSPYSPDNCHLYIWYHAPVPNPIPF